MLLFLANGTPMMRAGDEFMQTQHGNSNPYNQDNETTWLDWSLMRRNAGIHRFFKQAIAFRKSHPSLARSRFWRDDVRWHGVGPAPDLSPDSHSLAFRLRGASQRDRDLYVMINAYWEPLAFTMQGRPVERWMRVVDTSLHSPDDFLEPGAERPLASPTYLVQPRSVVVLLEQ
jgi:glycogen operon protein